MITVIDDAVDALTCDFLVNTLVHTPRWNIGADIQGNFLNGNHGYILKSFEDGCIDYYDKYFVKLNVIAESIIDRIYRFALTDDYVSYNIKRFYWNHYNENGRVPEHFDYYPWQNPEKENLKSFLVHLTDSDAKNIINKEEIETKKGRMIIFDSQEILHESTPPTIPHRYTLNAVVSLKRG